MSNIEERLAEVERRLALLEVREVKPAPIAEPPVLDTPKEVLVEVKVENKRYDPANTRAGTYEDHVWFDCVYTLAKSSKPTRAIKGVIEFGDLFGEIRFRLNITLNELLVPAKPSAHPGVGFTYNQFMDQHQWMLATNLVDMKISFKAMHVIYADGTSETRA